jgi:hypothetical protein
LNLTFQSLKILKVLLISDPDFITYSIGKAVFTKRSLKDISLKCKDCILIYYCSYSLLGLENNIIARVERLNEDDSVTVSLFIGIAAIKSFLIILVPDYRFN